MENRQKRPTPDIAWRNQREAYPERRKHVCFHARRTKGTSTHLIRSSLSKGNRPFGTCAKKTRTSMVVKSHVEKVKLKRRDRRDSPMHREKGNAFDGNILKAEKRGKKRRVVY